MHGECVFRPMHMASGFPDRLRVIRLSEHSLPHLRQRILDTHVPGVPFFTSSAFRFRLVLATQDFQGVPVGLLRDLHRSSMSGFRLRHRRSVSSLGLRQHGPLLPVPYQGRNRDTSKGDECREVT
jgi:hypothetical protein